ncbi:MAG: hypothetical protein ABDH31_04740 [Chlorobiota bacterium]
MVTRKILPLLQNPIPKQKDKNTTAALTTLLTFIYTTTAQNSLQWEFHHQRPTATWSGSFSTASSLFSRDSLWAKLSYSGLGERVPSASFRDDVGANVRYSYLLSVPWQLESQLTGYYLRDTRLSGRPESARWQATVGLLHSLPRLQVGGGGGWEILRQFSRSDWGMSGYTRLRWDGVAGVWLQAQLAAEGTRFQGQRRRYDVQAHIASRGGNGDTLFAGSARLMQNDFPGFGPDELQRRHEQHLRGFLILDEPLLPALRWQLRLRMQSMRVVNTWVGGISEISPMERTRLNGEAENMLNWSLPLGAIRVTADLQYSEEAHRLQSLPMQLGDSQRQQQERLKDFTSLWVRFATSAHLRLSQRDSLLLIGSIALLRYDTPSPQNTDDRDEQHLSTALTHRRSWGGAVTTTLTVEFQGRHLVFLLAPRSAWNHWLYTLALRWQGKWATGRLMWQPTWEVRATYTVRDYDYTTVLRDLSLRQWSYRDSIWIRLSAEWEAEVGYIGRITRIGLLQWKAFSEQPQAQVQEQSGGLLFVWGRGRQSWGIGARFLVSEYREHRGEGSRSSYGLGPQARVVLQTAYGTLTAMGWYELRRSDRDQQWSVVPWLTLSFRTVE